MLGKLVQKELNFRTLYGIVPVREEQHSIGHFSVIQQCSHYHSMGLYNNIDLDSSSNTKSIRTFSCCSIIQLFHIIAEAELVSQT